MAHVPTTTPHHLYQVCMKTLLSLSQIVDFGTVCVDKHIGIPTSGMGHIIHQLFSGMIKTSKNNPALKKITVVIPYGNINLVNNSFHVHKDGFNLEVRHQVANLSIHNQRIRGFLADELMSRVGLLGIGCYG